VVALFPGKEDGSMIKVAVLAMFGSSASRWEEKDPPKFTSTGMQNQMFLVGEMMTSRQRLDGIAITSKAHQTESTSIGVAEKEFEIQS
jgi:hypothetical protein